MSRKYIKLDPPGTWCHHEAVFDLIKKNDGKSFIEIGCGAGDLSRKLCDRGYHGIGVDYSKDALEQANTNLKPFLENEQYHLVEGNFMEIDGIEESQDMAFSMMVMEHIEDDLGFLQRMKKTVKPDGHVIIAVPGRRDKWSIEDDTVGHHRRYDREDLEKVMRDAGLEDIKIWSVAVPVANILFYIGEWIIKRRPEETKKTDLDMREQTETSGIREIPFKTVFPPWCKLILNRITLFPFFLIQKLFYKTNLGITLLASGRVKETQP